MKIRVIRIRNFKRFTDLTISGIPQSAKLVLVIGPNGCGKSSLFEAFLNWRRWGARKSLLSDDDYFLKEQSETSRRSNATANAVVIEAHGEIPSRNPLYVRTAHRNEADFVVSDFRAPGDPEAITLGRRLIDDDKTVAANYQRLVFQATSAIFDTENDEKSVRVLREELTGSVRNSLNNVFEDLEFHHLQDPLGQEHKDRTFFFKKGSVDSFHYKNLSGGEKAVFDVLLDLHLNKRQFPEAVYCIDEIETHLHTAVQSALVREIVRIIPEAGQLWLSSHSLGVLRAAEKIEAEFPGSTCIVDFEGVDLDEECEISPVNLGRITWQKMLSITLDDLAESIAPNIVVVCEGSSSGRRRKDFDAAVLDTVFGHDHPRTVFVSGGNNFEAVRAGSNLSGIFEAILPGASIFTVIDRDDQSEAEIANRDPNVLVLGERNLESYLLSDDVLERLVADRGQPDHVESVLEIKRESLRRSVERGNPPDDLKSAAGEIYEGLRRTLNLQGAGSNADAFLRFTLAPLLKPGMQSYERLNADIFGKIDQIDVETGTHWK